MESSVLVSLIIPAHDEERLIGRTVRNLRAAGAEAGLEFEVVVADDASSDRTGPVAEEAGARVVRHERRQIAATRNLGARAAKGELLIFVDADTWPSGIALRQVVEAIEKGAVGGGASMIFDGQIPRYARLLIPVFNLGFRLKRRSGGAFFYCTRKAFEAAGEWDETVYAGEEIFFAIRLNKVGRFVVIKEPVMTSGRKLRSHSGLELFGVLCRLALSRDSLRSRDKLDVWYGPRRREDPGQ